MKSFLTYLKEVALYHSSNVMFPDNKPNFDAYFGNKEFSKVFANDFGKHTYEIDLPNNANILQLDVDSGTTRKFMAACAKITYPGKSGEDYAKELLAQGDDPSDGESDFYEVWTDKDIILKALKRTNFAGVTYRSEWILPRTTIQKLKSRKVR